METRRSTVGVLVAVAAVLVGSLVPAGASDCPMCTTTELTLLGIGAFGAAVGAWLALSDRRWTRRLLPVLGTGLVATATVYAVRFAV